MIFRRSQRMTRNGNCRGGSHFSLISAAIRVRVTAWRGSKGRAYARVKPPPTGRRSDPGDQVRGGCGGEAHLSAAQPAAAAQARVPSAHAHAERKEDPGSPPGQGEKSSERLWLGRTMPSGDVSLRSRQAIDKLFKEGTAHRAAHVLLIQRRTQRGPRRVMFVASRRVGNAVHRNRAKRLMREAYRSLAPALSPQPVHLAWIARASCARSGLHEVRDNMTRLLKTADLLLANARMPSGAGVEKPPETDAR